MTNSARLVEHSESMLLCGDAKPGPWLVRSHDTKVRVRCRVKPDLESLFHSLAKTWKEETWMLSSIKKRISHPAYLKIVGMGPDAVPLLLHELQEDTDYWFAALEAITREDPAPDARNMQELRDAWLAWGSANGYIS